MPEMKVDDLLKIYVSLGALAPEAMPNALAKAGSAMDDAIIAPSMPEPPPPPHLPQRTA
jgi:uncharacterized membrane protein